MPKPQKYRDVIKFVKTQGWVFLRQGKGSHEMWGLADESVKESIPAHGEVTAGIIGQLIKKLPNSPQNWREEGMTMSTKTRTFEATATREGKWWFIEIPELDTVGQARSVAEIPAAAREVAALWLNVDPSEVEVNVTVRVPEDVNSLWATANEKEAAAREAVKEAARLRREAIGMLAARGITQRDSGRLLGLSTQRVNQLTHS